MRDMVRRDERQALSREEIDRRIVAAIVAAQTARGTVTLADIARANIPTEHVSEDRLRRLVARAREAHPELDRIWGTP